MTKKKQQKRKKQQQKNVQRKRKQKGVSLEQAQKEKKPLLKILYIPTLNVPVCFWRIENYAHQMVRMKSEVMVNVEYFTEILDITMAWDDACVGKGQISEDIQTKLRNGFKFFDILIFQRIQNMPALALIAEFRKEYPEVVCVAELDDSVGEVSPSSPHKWTSHHRWSAEHLHRSDAVICSTDYLAKSIKPIIGDKPIHVAPNCIDRLTWKFKKSKQGHEGIRLGYVGGGAHDEDLRIIDMALRPILKANPDVTWVIRYGGFRPDWLEEHPQIDYECVGWYMNEYPQKLADLDLDIALAPLRDSEFNRCKSNLKWLEWASLDVPVIASNVEPYKKTQGDIILVDNAPHIWQKCLLDAFESIRKHGFLNTVYSLRNSNKVLHEQHREYNNLYEETKKVLIFLKNLL